MKQRSLARSPAPKEKFQACIRSGYLKQNYESKPASGGSSKLIREHFKKFYKKQKNKDREVGLQITRLFAEFFYERNCIRKSGQPADQETIKYLGKLAANIKELRETTRFKDDFPSFAMFYRYVRKEKVTLKELEDLQK